MKALVVVAGLALLAVNLSSLGRTASAQDEASKTEVPALGLRARPGDAFAFRHRYSEKVVSGLEWGVNHDWTAEREYVCRVVTADEEAVMLDVEFTKASGRLQRDDEPPVSYDTSKPEDATLDPETRALVRRETMLVGAKIRVWVTRRNKVVATEGIGTAMKRALAGTPRAHRADRFDESAEGPFEVAGYFPKMPSEDQERARRWTDEVLMSFRQIAVEVDVTSRIERVPEGIRVVGTLKHDPTPESAKDFVDSRSQRNTSSGQAEQIWSGEDGFIVKSSRTFKFKSSGGDAFEGSYSTSHERIPVPATFTVPDKAR